MPRQYCEFGSTEEHHFQCGKPGHNKSCPGFDVYQLKVLSTPPAGFIIPHISVCPVSIGPHGGH